MSSLMTLASASLVLHSTFAACADRSNEAYADNILILSHGAALTLLILYFMYLFFQLRTHADLFDTFDEELTETPDELSGEAPERRSLGPIAASVGIIILSTIVAVCAMFLIGSIESIVQTFQIPKSFIGIILIPIIGSVAEYPTTCTAAWRNKMDLVIGLAIGNSMEIALFVTPFLVILGWVVQESMTFNFSDFEVMTFFVSVFVVVYVIQNGKSNYMVGIMCLGVYVAVLSIIHVWYTDFFDTYSYIIIALAVWVLPDDESGIRTLVAYLLTA
jgi:Ca2+:H+ antiporter